MFSKKEQTKPSTSKPSGRNTICENTSIKGEVISEGDFRIDGTLEGTLKTNGRVVIGKEGSILGTVTCQNADIEGRFNGDLKVTETLTVKGSASISGDVVIGKLAVEAGANFNATCQMKGGVKELKQENVQEKATATA